jgi:hypothetical protein
MKKLIFLITLTFLLNSVCAFAMKPIFPPIKDKNWTNTQENFNNIVYSKRTLTAGASSYVISPLSLDTNSAAMAQLNTNEGHFVKSTVVGSNSVTVYLDGVLTTNADLTIIGFSK